jgi:hypothetical protein
MELEGSLPHSKVPDTFLFLKPAQSNLSRHISLPKDPYYLASTPGSPHWSLFLSFPHQNHGHHILVDFVTRTMLGEQYTSLRSSLCIFFLYPVTSSFLGPNILLNTISLVFLSIWANKFHTHTKQQTKL